MNMSTQTPEPRTKGAQLNEGKTKRIFADLADPLGVIVESKYDITAGDGAKHDIIPEKARLANQTTCNVFRLLKSAGIDVAFNEQIDEVSFSSPRVTMIPLEVVVRREGGYGKTYPILFPHIKKGTIFPRLVFETYLKTKDRTWKECHDLPCDDPLAVYMPHKCGFDIYDVKKAFIGQEPFLFVPEAEVFEKGLNVRERLSQMEKTARMTFLILEKAWQLLGRRLLDFKIEFAGLLVADVIDNDSWRLLKDGAHEDKQVYRDGGELSEVAINYRRVADLTDRFGLPRQSVVIWRGSDKDDQRDIQVSLTKLSKGEGMLPTEGFDVFDLVCSMHKLPVQGLYKLRKLEQECPDSVIIAYIGMSNGAGPTLSAHTTMPVISVPASIKNFPEDVWSSLRTPSDVPTPTVLGPTNAAQLALNILSAHNPALYAWLRYRMEERFINTIVL